MGTSQASGLSVRTGNRLVHVDGEEVWLVLLPTQQQDRYRVLLLRSDVDFEVSAGTDEECLDEIVRELRRRDRRVP